MPETVKLNKPVTQDGKELAEVIMDLDSLTGADLATAEKEFVMSGGVASNMSASIGYHQCVAARACGIDIETVRAMTAKDAAYLATRAQIFLLDMELPATSGSSEDCA